MNIGNMPGYTAETSLYSRDSNRSVSERDASMAEVVPQTISLSQSASQGLGGQGISSGGWQCWYFPGCMICCNPVWCWWACWGRAAQA